MADRQDAAAQSSREVSTVQPTVFFSGRHAWITIAISIYFAYLPMRSFVHILMYLVVLGCQLVLVLISIHVQLLCKL